MASAGIRKTPTGRDKVWWRLADASQGSRTFATRDQARDYVHDLLARLGHGSWVDPQLGRQTFETLGARVVGRLGRQSPPQPKDTPSRRGAPAAVPASARAIRRRGGVAGCLGGCSGSGSAVDRQGGTTYQNDRCMTSGRRRLEGREGMEKLLLTPEEAAAALGICRSKLYELLQAGVIESVHIGTSRRIPVAAMVEYVERLRQEATA
jgi:excisionase family DNA binding protein